MLQTDRQIRHKQILDLATRLLKSTHMPMTKQTTWQSVHVRGAFKKFVDWHSNYEIRTSYFVTFQHRHLQLKCTWSSVSPKLWYRCRRIVSGLPASHLPLNANTNDKYGGWRSTSKLAFWMTASAWADLWSDAMSWRQVTSVFSQTERIHEKTQNFLTTRMLSTRHMAGWKTKNNNSSTTGSELWRNAGPSAF